MALNERGEMPKETFYPVDPDHDGPDERLEIAWHREVYDTVWATMCITREDGVVVPVAIQLDRSGVNRLIKTLKKARDQTFGADE